MLRLLWSLQIGKIDRSERKFPVSAIAESLEKIIIIGCCLLSHYGSFYAVGLSFFEKTQSAECLAADARHVYF